MVHSGVSSRSWSITSCPRRVHLGVHHAGRDAVDPDAAGAKLFGKRFGQSNYRPFVAEYAASQDAPTCPHILATVTMLPRWS